MRAADVVTARQSRRLDSWKEIALFFGRDERTVKRWETRRGLPVCRLPGGGKTTVYAYVDELESWLKTGGAAEGDAAPRAPDALPASRPSGLRLLLAGLAILTAVAAGVAALRLPSASGPAHSANSVADQFYLKGLYSWQTRTASGLVQAIGDFREAIARDPNFAPAYAGLAECYALMPEFAGMTGSAAYPKARAAALRAVELDGSLADAHRALAFVDFWWTHDVTGALREFRRAVSLAPNSAQTHHWYANVLGMIGRSRESIAEIEKAQELAPGSTAILADKGLLLADAGRFDESLQLLKQIETAEPGFAPVHAYLAAVYRFRNEDAPWLAELRLQARLTHDADSLAVVDAGERGLAEGGAPAMERSVVAEEQELFDRGRFSPYLLAMAYARVGDRDRALAILGDAVARRDTLAMALRIERVFLGLHGDPRFAALLAREGLPPLSDG